MIICTSGFFGKYSRQLGTAELGIPYMQPFSFNNEHAEPSFLPALNFASILEDKGLHYDLTSRMKYEGTSFMPGSEFGRDYFLFSTNPPSNAGEDYLHSLAHTAYSGRNALATSSIHSEGSVHLSQRELDAQLACIHMCRALHRQKWALM
jgi:hypothetical protein